MAIHHFFHLSYNSEPWSYVESGATLELRFTLPCGVRQRYRGRHMTKDLSSLLISKLLKLTCEGSCWFVDILINDVF